MYPEIKPKANWKIYLGIFFIFYAALLIVFTLLGFYDLTPTLLISIIATICFRLAIAFALITYGNKQKWENYYIDIMRVKRVSNIQQIATIAGKDIKEVQNKVRALYSGRKLVRYGININLRTDQITYDSYDNFNNN